jgi:hypothetical protein
MVGRTGIPAGGVSQGGLGSAKVRNVPRAEYSRRCRVIDPLSEARGEGKERFATTEQKHHSTVGLRLGWLMYSQPWFPFRGEFREPRNRDFVPMVRFSGLARRIGPEGRLPVIHYEHGGYTNSLRWQPACVSTRSNGDRGGNLLQTVFVKGGDRMPSVIPNRKVYQEEKS